MHVLLTGSDGYIGSVAGPLLAERGHSVTTLDTGFYRSGRLGEEPQGSPPPAILKDIRDLSVVDLVGFDVVVHLAELSNDPLSQFMPDVTYEINHRGSVALAERCIEAGVPRFVYASSCSVYGIGSEDVKDESSPLHPQTTYAECKVLVERDLTALASDEFSPVFLRNATVYGPSPNMRFDLVVNNLSGQAWTTAEIRMTSDGSPWRPLVHVLDVAEAIACAVVAPTQTIHGQIFNVGRNDNNYRIRDLAEMVSDTFPDCALTVGSSGGDNRSYRVSFDKIHGLLPGFESSRRVDAGISELREFYETVQLTTAMFEQPAFTRLRQLRDLVEAQKLDQHLRWSKR